MKKIITNLMRISMPLAIIASVFVAQPAFAGYAFNTGPGNCNLVSVINSTTMQGYSQPCWNGTNVTVQPGQEFQFKVAFTNSGDTPANQVAVRMNPISGSTVSGTRTLTGDILVGGSRAAGGSVSVTFPSSVRVELVKVEFQTSDGRISNITNDSSLFSSSGRIVAGTLMPNPADFGTIKAAYRVTAVNDGGNDNFYVDTLNYSDFDEENGDVQLNGSYHENDGSNVYAYFAYARDGGVIRYTSEQSVGSSSSNTFSADLDNLASGDYEYVACARNADDDDCGDTRSFTIDRDDGGCTSNCGGNDEELDATTLSADDVDENSAQLRGNVEAGDRDIDECWFEYGTSSSNLNKTKNVNCSIDSNDDEDISANISGLDEDEEYFFRVCAEDSSGDDDCGTIKSFSTDEEEEEDDEDRPDIETLSPIQISTTSAIVDGTYDMNGCSGETWFDYGTSNSFGSRTSRVSHSGSASGSMNQTISGLSSNRTYYYRAAGSNCSGTTYGSTRSFRTTTTTVTPPIVIDGGTRTIIRNTVTTVGGGSSFLKLTIDNGQDTVIRGEILSYDVTWENISNQDLKDLVLDVSFPDALQLVRTDRGQIDRASNTVYVNIRDLRKGEKDSMTINARVVGNLRDNDPVTARAIMAFENPINQAQENAIAYDSDTYLVASSVLGASIFGLDFLPGTLAGWLFVILLLILLILVIRYAMGRRNDHGPRGGNGMGGNGYVAPAPMPSNTYSESADYTPYRPTPRA